MPWPEIALGLAFLAFLAWFPLTARAIDRAYNPKITVVVKRVDLVEVNGVLYQHHGHRWYRVGDCKELPLGPYDRAADAAVREWCFRATHGGA